MVRRVDSSSSGSFLPKPLAISYAVWDKNTKKWMTPVLSAEDQRYFERMIENLRNNEALNKSFKEGATLEITEKGVFIKDKKTSRKKYIDLLSDKKLSSSRKTYQAITKQAVKILGIYSKDKVVKHKALETNEKDEKVLSRLSGSEKAVIEVTVRSEEEIYIPGVINLEPDRSIEEVDKLLVRKSYQNRFEKLNDLLLKADPTLMKILKKNGWSKEAFNRFDRWEREFGKTIQPLYELSQLAHETQNSTQRALFEAELRKLAIISIPKLNQLGKDFRKLGGAKKLLDLQKLMTEKVSLTNLNTKVYDLERLINQRVEWTNQLYDDTGLRMNWPFREMKELLLSGLLATSDVFEQALSAQGLSRNDLKKLYTLISNFMLSYEPIYLAGKRLSKDDANPVLRRDYNKILAKHEKRANKNLKLLDKWMGNKGLKLSAALDPLRSKLDKKGVLYGHISRVQELLDNVQMKRQQFLNHQLINY